MKTNEELNILAAKACGFDTETKVEHTWKLYEDEVDNYAWFNDFHYGRLCIKCGYSYCIACKKESEINQKCIPDYPNFCNGDKIDLLLKLIEDSNKRLQFIKNFYGSSVSNEFPSIEVIYSRLKLMYDFPYVVKCCLLVLDMVNEKDL